MTNSHDRPTQTFASIGIDNGKEVFHTPKWSPVDLRPMADVEVTPIRV